MTELTIKRIEGLDWLRGLMALSIMTYHYMSWGISEQSISTILGRLGIYAVSIFFVLSGLSLALVYSNYIKDIRTAAFFFIRRIFRIWPVLWFTIAAFVLLALYNRKTVDFYIIFMNLTTLFGFFDIGRYMSPGVWSIGNEMVYYSITPITIALYNLKRLYGNIFFAATVIIGAIFSAYLIDGRSILAEEWKSYINPFNNMFFFVSGLALYYNLKNIKLDTRKKKCVHAVFFAIILLSFVFINVKGDAMEIVTGINRLIFSFLSISAVFLFWKLDFILPKLIHKPWMSVCLSAYPIYLLHPIVLETVKTFAKGEIFRQPSFLIFFSATLTVGLSVVVHKYIEKPFIKLGKKITPRESAI